MTANYSDSDYLAADPFFGDEAELSCRTVSIRQARKNHVCYSLNGSQDHQITVGEKYRHEKALVDGSFWGEYKICLHCMDKFLKSSDADEEE